MPPSIGDDEDEDELTLPQRIFWKGMTDQRVANIFLMADVFGDMDGEGLQFMRALGDPGHTALRRFLTQSKPETLKFLTELRDKEVEDIAAALETARSIQRTVKVIRWGVMAMGATFLAVVATWDKLVTFFSKGAR